jgi:hypothetical protein
LELQSLLLLAAGCQVLLLPLLLLPLQCQG